jgi:hypothetical protein
MEFSSDTNSIIEDFNRIIEKAQNIAIFSRAIEIQLEEIDVLKFYDEALQSIKEKFIFSKDEENANQILCVQYLTRTIMHELSFLVCSKQDKMDEAWDNLVHAQILVQNVVRNQINNANNLTNYIERLHFYEALMFPKMKFSSIGGIVIENECSICGKDYEECDHLKGKFYMGEMCCKIIKKFEPEEVSLVDNPANKMCRIITITNDNGENIDVLTLRKK